MSNTAGGGRGMQIVQALSSRWGSDEHQGGKRVWVGLDAAGADFADA